MNPFQVLLEKLAKLVGSVTTIKSSLPDANSLEKDSAVAAQARNLTANCQSLEDAATEFQSMLTGLADRHGKNELSEEQLSAAKAQLIASGELLSKADHEIARDAAVDAKITELNASAAEKEAARTQVENNRKELAKTIKSEEVLSRIPDEVLGADDFATKAKKITDRFERLGKSNIKSESAYAEVASLALDDDGDQAFETKAKFWEELSKGSRSGASPAAGGSGAPSFGSGSGDGSDAPVVMV